MSSTASKSSHSHSSGISSSRSLSIEQAKEYFPKSLTRDLLGHKKKVHSVSWNSSGKRLASGSVDQTGRVWPLTPTGHLSKELELKGHTKSVDQISWHPTDENVLATASADCTLRLWDGRSGRCQHTIKTVGENINMSWHPHGNVVVVGNKDDTLSFIDTRTNKVFKDMKFAKMVNEVSWNKEGDLFFITLGVGCVHVAKYPSLEGVWTSQGHSAAAYCLQFDPTGRYFAVGGADALMSLWDAKELVCLRTYDQLEWPVRTVSFSHDSKFLGSGSEDLHIDISSVETGEHIYSIPCKGATNTVAWHPSEYLLAHSGDDSRHSTNVEVKVFGIDPATASSEVRR